MPAQFGKALADAALDDILKLDDAEQTAARDRGAHRPRLRGDEDDGRDEDRGDLVHQSLDRSPGRLSAAHHVHNLGQHTVCADPCGADPQRAGAVHRGPDDLGTGVFLDRDRLARHHRFVDR